MVKSRFLGDGATGCLLTPMIDCKNLVIDPEYKDVEKVSKIYTSLRKAQQEAENYEHLKVIDANFDWTTPLVSSCNEMSNKTSTDVLKSCALSDVIYKFDHANQNIFVDAGIDMEHYLNGVRQKHSLPLFEDLLYYFISIFEGLKNLNTYSQDKRLHQDIQPRNLLFNSTNYTEYQKIRGTNSNSSPPGGGAKVLTLIDFSLCESHSKIYSLDNMKNTNWRCDSYPPEYSLYAKVYRDIANAQYKLRTYDVIRKIRKEKRLNKNYMLIENYIAFHYKYLRPLTNKIAEIDRVTISKEFSKELARFDWWKDERKNQLLSLISGLTSDEVKKKMSLRTDGSQNDQPNYSLLDPENKPMSNARLSQVLQIQTDKIDTYSLGITMLQLFSDAIKRKRCEWKDNQAFYTKFLILMHKMTNFNPVQRIGIVQAHKEFVTLVSKYVPDKDVTTDDDHYTRFTKDDKKDFKKTFNQYPSHFKNNPMLEDLINSANDALIKTNTDLFLKKDGGRFTEYPEFEGAESDRVSEDENSESGDDSDDTDDEESVRESKHNHRSKVKKRDVKLLETQRQGV